MKTFLVTLLTLLVLSTTAQEEAEIYQYQVQLEPGTYMLSDYLKTLENQVAGLIFVYSPKVVDVNKSIVCQNELVSIREALNRVFEVDNFEIKAKGRKLLIKKKSKKLATNKASNGMTLTYEARPDDVDFTNTLDYSLNDRTALNLVVEFPSSEETDQRSHLFVNRKPLNPGPSHRLDTELRTNANGFIGSEERLDSLYEDLVVESRKGRGFRFFLSTSVGLTQLGQESALTLGGSLIYLRRQNFGIGLGGQALISGLSFLPPNQSTYRIAGGYGGLQLDYLLRPDRKLHFSTHLIVGGGGIAFLPESFEISGQEGVKAFAVLQPSVLAELNVTDFFRVALGASYRFTSDASLQITPSNITILENAALNGFGLEFHVKLGRF